MTGHPATYKHVIVIMMENHSYPQLIGQSDAPFINQVAKSCGVATNYHNVTHLSWANYIAITNGQNPTCIGCKVAGPSVFTQAGSWSGYAEAMANPCAYTGTTIYARPHNPATYYTALIPTCRQRDINLGSTGSGALYNALADGTLARYTMITPNLCDDMHNCGVATGDSWLRSWIGLITNSQLYQSGQVVVFVTRDEGWDLNGSTPRAGEYCLGNTTDPSCHVALLALSPYISAGRHVATLFSHYSLLKTTEQLLGLPLLGHANDASTISMRAGFGI